jgi:hypothetical protein
MGGQKKSCLTKLIYTRGMLIGLFAWLISHQPALLFSHNKPATSNQPAVLLSQNKPVSAISHHLNEQAMGLVCSTDFTWGP